MGPSRAAAPVGAVAGAVVARHRPQVGVDVALVGAVDGARHARPRVPQGQRAGHVLARDLVILTGTEPQRRSADGAYCYSDGTAWSGE